MPSGLLRITDKSAAAAVIDCRRIVHFFFGPRGFDSGLFRTPFLKCVAS